MLDNRAKVVTEARPPIARLLTSLGTSSSYLSAQRKIPAKFKPESHHMKIKVVKERKENGGLVYKDLNSV